MLDMPAIRELHQRYESKGLVVLGINSDKKDDREKVMKLLQGSGYGKWSHYLMADDIKGDEAKAGKKNAAINSVTKRFWVRGWPTSFLVGKDGKIISRRLRFYNAEQKEKSAKLIEKALGLK